jgi:hypothetical protein
VKHAEGVYVCSSHLYPILFSFATYTPAVLSYRVVNASSALDAFVHAVVSTLPVAGVPYLSRMGRRSGGAGAARGASGGCVPKHAQSEGA